ncbi:putative membrane protein YeiB [Kribbella aluminosa]|uniref:Membrane protein YeiB n=1 Tax=Kribbella aluminosa TaxID=416017 RepID=A0ABS4UW75_9ACTN|nr:DUF418 domain-containing protein [Kribbella aluminosa]MBP2355903.1 putative membrane protein YeiB [Kribbella aluminosa]
MSQAQQARPASGAAAGAVPVGERILAPDLARGFALLLVALAHSTGILNHTVPGVDLEPHGLERVFYLVMFVFVHACALPLFAMLFGYGLVQFQRHQDDRGVPAVTTRAALLRRHLGLFVIGALHGIFLFVGDVLGAFAVVGAVLTVLVLRRGKWVYRVALGYLAFGLVYLAVLAVRVYPSMAAGTTTDVPAGPDTTAQVSTYAASIADRLTDWPLSTLVLLSTILFAWVGVWAARKRVLEEPQRHGRLLWSGVIAGFGVAIAGALPMALTAAAIAGPSQSLAGDAKHLYEGAGLFGAVGYACVFGLIGRRLARRPRLSTPARALVALGQRSLTFYLFQSVCWLVLLTHYGLRLGERTGSPAYTALVCAVGVWLVSLVAASLLHRHGWRGPVERLIRWFTHRGHQR